MKRKEEFKKDEKLLGVVGKKGEDRRQEGT